MCIAGTAEVVKAGYPDHFARESGHKYFDESATEDNPIWYMVHITLTQIFRTPVTREMLSGDLVCREMMVMKKGSRLSIQPVTADEWAAVHRLAEG